eukprot:TRINITY_DN5547_c0_g1_i1.p1 TRINITY_DN5547_c0_g1~~TRINITY_DN5547_c0_g1_i1.p1  ORF type:complete len:379 (+),score=69.31 TRINITY_DN5547_c0_g1_i1:108-1139(+)
MGNLPSSSAEPEVVPVLSKPIQPYEVPPPKGTNFWEIVDEPLIIKILSFCSPKELCSLSRVCKKLNYLSETNEIWQQIFENSHGVLYLDYATNKSYKHWYKLEAIGRNSPQTLPISNSQGKCCAGMKGSKEGTAQTNVRIATQQYEQLSPVKKLHEGAKLVMLGDSSAGKSSLVLRLCRGVFSPYHEATIGASFLVQQLVVDDTPVKFQIWDTAGSERFHSLAPMYYRGAVAAIVVYDISNYESFERVQKWVDELQNQRSNLPPPIIAIVGNKEDLIGLKGREVKKEVAQSLAYDKGDLIWMETSARTGKNVVKLFATVAQALRKRAIEDEAMFHQKMKERYE